MTAASHKNDAFSRDSLCYQSGHKDDKSIHKQDRALGACATRTSLRANSWKQRERYTLDKLVVTIGLYADVLEVERMVD